MKERYMVDFQKKLDEFTYKGQINFYADSLRRNAHKSSIFARKICYNIEWILREVAAGLRV